MALGSSVPNSQPTEGRVKLRTTPIPSPPPEPLVSTTLQDAYVAVERAYSLQQFPEALRLALDLLPRIPTGSDDQLDLRLQLLMGHTYLYGLGLPQQALPCYQQVLKLSYDPTYRELAEQGVTLCQQAGASPLAAENPSSGSFSTGPSLGVTNDAPPSASVASGAAVPWLEDLSSMGTAQANGSPQGPTGQVGAVTAAQPWATAKDGPGQGELVERIERIEPELVERIGEPAPDGDTMGGLGAPQAFSPAEAAELAKGLLKVVLR